LSRLAEARPTRRYSPGPPYHWTADVREVPLIRVHLDLFGATKNGVLGQLSLVVNAMHMIPSVGRRIAVLSTDWMVAVCRHAATCGPDGAAGYDWMTLLRSIASDVVKPCNVLGALDTALVRRWPSLARERRVDRRSEVGMKPARDPSATVAVDENRVERRRRGDVDTCR